MSSSLASLKQRRAGIQTATKVLEPAVAAVPTPPTGRMSLPQLLNNFESRLKAMETSKTDNNMSFNVKDPETGVNRKMSFADYMTDMDNKFFMLADEITSIKDIVVKLQCFTMEVNKTLMEERVRILDNNVV
jgi:hypothetical protein